MQLRQIVGPHQPDKAHTRIEPLQGGKSVAGHARAQLRLDPGDLDMRVMDDVARLRDVNTSSHPLVFRTNMEAGHGGKSGRFRRYREQAEMYSFMLDQLGVKATP